MAGAYPLTSEPTSLQNRCALLCLFAGYASFCWWVFTPMMLALHVHWTTANDQDAGYLLLAFLLYMLWQTAGERGSAWTRGRDRTLRPIALAGFILCIAAASLAAITANKSVTLALLVIGFVPLCVWTIGVRKLSSVLHACAILLMATPIWYLLVPQLQTLTATAVNWLLSRGNWPIFIEGNLITLPQGMLEIAAGCAGLKFLQTAIALTLIEGFLARRSWRAMALIGLVCAALAVVSNWFRVSVITLLALELDPAHPWVADHNWVGWLLFALIFGPLFFWLGRVELFTRSRQTVKPTITGAARTGGRAMAALAVASGCALSLASAAEGEDSARIGRAQVAAVQQLCLEDPVGPSATPVAPAANFPGAQLVVDCLTPGGRRLSLRGYLRELQEQEVINPVNQLAPGLGLLDYAVTSQRHDAAAGWPALVDAGEVSRIAYGFYATGAWTANKREFKARSLLRPFVPGPVFVLILSEPSVTRTELKDAAVTAEFIEFAELLRHAR